MTTLNQSVQDEKISGLPHEAADVKIISYAEVFRRFVSIEKRMGIVEDIEAELQSDVKNNTKITSGIAEDTSELLEKTRGQPYDWRGAIATRFPSTPQAGAWVCNEWVAEPYLQASSSFGPHHLAAICMSAGRDGTHSFFWDRE